MALKKSWQTGAFNFTSQDLKEFPIELFHMDDINLDGEEWWSKNITSKIDLSNNAIAILPENFENLYELVALRIESNRIQEMPSKFFEQLKNLKSLSLQKNNLTKFDLYWCPNLVELQLSENHIQDFLDKPFLSQNLLSLEILDLRQNQLTFFPYLSSGKVLRKLNLSQNRIQQIGRQLENCNLLEDLILFKNQISQIEDGAFDKLENLRVLDLRENKLIQFIQSYIGGQHRNIDQLILSFNQLRIYNVYEGIENITILLLNNNKLEQLDQRIINFKNLKTLDISNNDLPDIPSEIALLPQLVRLQIEGNTLKCIRPNIRNAGAEVLKKYLKTRIQDQEKVQTIEKQLNNKGINYSNDGPWDAIFRNFLLRDELVAKKQNLSNYDQKIFEIRDLRVVDLSENNFNIIDQNFRYLQKLQKISFNQNSINDFPFFLQFIPNLQELELNSNKLTTMETREQINGFYNLRLLNVSTNQIKQIPRWIQNLSSLAIFNAAYNKLDSIENLIAQPNNLEVIDVSNNQINEISDNVYNNCSKLHHLNIANNNFSNIPTILGFINLRTIQVEGNPTKTLNRAIISKGPAQILDYLKNKHPHEKVPQTLPICVNKQTESQDQTQFQQQQYGMNTNNQNQNQRQQQQQYYPPQQSFQQFQKQNSDRIVEEPFNQKQQQLPVLNKQEIWQEINNLNQEISYLEKQIQDDFTLNKFQKQDKKKILQQKLLQRNSLQSKLQ